MTYAGGRGSFELYMRLYEKTKQDFIVEIYGGLKVLYVKGRVYRFSTHNYKDIGMATACRSVIYDVGLYEKEYGVITTTPNSPMHYKDEYTFLALAKEGLTKFSAIDISACYWNIAFNSGILREKTYKKYLNKKEHRLIAIGNLNKLMSKNVYEKGILNPDKSGAMRNNHAWVWDFVTHEAYSIFQDLQDICGNMIFKFHTDCVYAPNDCSQKIINRLKSKGFKCTHDVYKIDGMCGNKMICINSEKRDIKAINFQNHKYLLEKYGKSKYGKSSVDVSLQKIEAC